MENRLQVIAFPHPPSDIGGPGSFQSRLEDRLKLDGKKVLYANSRDKVRPDVVLVVGGTGKILWLFFQKLRGVRIVHRLDGKNWQQSVATDGLYIGIKSRLVNWLIWGIKYFLADAVVYQSEFVADIWERNSKPYFKSDKDRCVIYNAVSTKEFYPIAKNTCASRDFSVICAEGSINGAPAISILRSIADIRVDVYGQVSKEVSGSFNKSPQYNVNFKGVINRSRIPQKLAGCKIFLNLETNPPCPNAVIEAMSAGVPVVGFDSGSLQELVGDAGVILPYGAGDPWLLEPPESSLLNDAIKNIIDNYSTYSSLARERAEEVFSLDAMYDEYCKVLFKQ